jgi:curved DNA-binding protein CbpA
MGDPMSKKRIVTWNDSLKERAFQILNLRYLIKQDIQASYRKRILTYHPDRHPENNDNPHQREESTNRMMVINQAHELLLDLLQNNTIDRRKYPLLENTSRIQSLLPQNVTPTPLGKTEMEIWKERYGNGI